MPYHVDNSALGAGSIIFALPQFMGSKFETEEDATEELCMITQGDAGSCENFEEGNCT